MATPIIWHSVPATGNVVSNMGSGTNVFIPHGDDLTKGHYIDLSTQNTTPAEPFVLDTWGTRSQNGVLRTGCQASKTVQLINAVNGSKTDIRGTARFELTLDERLTFDQRYAVAIAVASLLFSVNQTEAAPSGTNYKMDDSNLVQFCKGLFVPYIGTAK